MRCQCFYSAVMANSKLDYLVTENVLLWNPMCIIVVLGNVYALRLQSCNLYLLLPIALWFLYWFFFSSHKNFSIRLCFDAFYPGFHRRAQVIKCKQFYFFLAKTGVMVPGMPSVEHGNWRLECVSLLYCVLSLPGHYNIQNEPCVFRAQSLLLALGAFVPPGVIF